MTSRRREISDPPFVHATAEVATNAQLGDGVKVWHHTQVLSGAVIGMGTTLGKGAYVDQGVRVGAWVKVQNYALLYRGAVVEDQVMLGPGVILTNDRYPRATTPDGDSKTDIDWLQEGVSVRKGASVGAHATLLPGVDVGEYALVAAGAVVVRNVAPHALVMGCPAREVGLVCRCGHRLDLKLWCRCGRRYVRTEEGIAPHDGQQPQR